MDKSWCRKINTLALRVSDIHQFAEYRSPGEIYALGRLGVVDVARLVAFAPRAVDPSRHSPAGKSPLGGSPARAGHGHVAYW